MLTLGTLDTSEAQEQAQDRSARQEDQVPLVRSKPAPVLPPGLPPGYPWRTFERRQPDLPLDDSALAQAGSDDDRRRSWPTRLRERAAISRPVRLSMGTWAFIRAHGTLSLCSCLALLLLGQVGTISLMALQTRISSAQVALSDSNGQDMTDAQHRASPLLTAALADALAGIPTGTASPTPASAGPTAPPAISDAISSDFGENYNTIDQPCHGSTFFVATITQWTVPPGCFARIYSPSPRDYPAASGSFGYCNWWPEVLHPAHIDILTSANYRHGSIPVPGAAIHFAPGEQGASMAGHYAQVVAVQLGSPWILVTEMNFTWRGGGFGKVDYRYIKVGAGMTFIYDS